MVKDGRQLVILEGLVLDIAEWIPYHPGGQFVLSQRIGYNLDRPFNGNEYAGIESDKGTNKKGHMHSTAARHIANKFVIAKYGYEYGRRGGFDRESLDFDDSAEYSFGLLAELNIHYAD
jgi:hypothetical protein